MTRLRKMMLEELQRRNYSAITTRNYLRVVADFAKYFGKSPDKLGPNELRTYQAYLLQERKLTPGTVVNWVAALRFFLHCVTTQARNWNSFGARGTEWRHAANGPKAGCEDGASGRGDWNRGCFGTDGVDEELAVWRDGTRSYDVCRPTLT